MKKIIFIFSILFSSVSIYAQSLKMIDLDKTKFPLISAKFYNYDFAYNKLTNTNLNDYTITENGIQRKILRISCDQQDVINPISSVLVFDVSSSMIEGFGVTKLEITKNAGKLWVNKLPENNFECAITTFSQQSNLLTDFTNDKQLLINKIDYGFYTGGGTYYNPAFLDYYNGAINIAKNGKFRRIIIFLTDGGPSDNPNYNQILSLANNYNISIYSLVIGLNVPNGLKRICDNTGGKCFDNIENQEELNNAYMQILNSTVINSSPCEIEWESDLTCDDVDNVFYTMNYIPTNQKFTSMYKVDSSQKVGLQIEPNNIDFTGESIGNQFQKKIKITSHNKDVLIKDIIPSNNDIKISSQSIYLKKGISQTITIYYTPKNNLYNKFYIKFNLNDCSYTVNLFGKANYNDIIIEDDSAYAGETKNLVIKTILKSPKPRNYKFKMAYNKTLLTVLDPKANLTFNDQNEICEYEGEWNGIDTILLRLPYIAGLGNAESTDISMLEFKWMDNNKSVETRKGHFYLLGICYEGGVRLVEPNITDIKISQQLNNSSLLLSYRTLFDNSTITLYDLMGKEIRKDNLLKSKNTTIYNLNIDGISSGTYLLVFKSGYHTLAKKIIIIHY